jgi:beta-aspartyl-peptidase (threonine type)
MVVAIQANASQKKSGQSREAQAIRAVMAAQVEAWNQGDLEGFMRGYWNSPDLTFYSGGLLTSGWKTTLDRYHIRYQTGGNEMGKLDFSDLQIEMLGPRSAFVRGHWHLKMAKSEPGGLFTLIFRKFPDGWKIIHDHTDTSS